MLYDAYPSLLNFFRASRTASSGSYLTLLGLFEIISYTLTSTYHGKKIISETLLTNSSQHQLPPIAEHLSDDRRTLLDLLDLLGPT